MVCGEPGPRLGRGRAWAGAGPGGRGGRRRYHGPVGCHRGRCGRYGCRQCDARLAGGLRGRAPGRTGPRPGVRPGHEGGRRVRRNRRRDGRHGRPGQDIRGQHYPGSRGQFAVCHHAGCCPRSRPDGAQGTAGAGRADRPGARVPAGPGAHHAAHNRRRGSASPRADYGTRTNRRRLCSRLCQQRADGRPPRAGARGPAVTHSVAPGSRTGAYPRSTPHWRRSRAACRTRRTAAKLRSTSGPGRRDPGAGRPAGAG